MNIQVDKEYLKNVAVLSKYSGKNLSYINNIIIENDYKDLTHFSATLYWLGKTKYKNFMYIDFNKEYIYCGINQGNPTRWPNLILGMENFSFRDSPLNNRISFEHYSLFERWNNITYFFYIPKTKEEFDKLYKLIEYVDSPQYIEKYNLYLENEDYEDTTYVNLLNDLKDQIDWNFIDIEYRPEELK